MGELDILYRRMLHVGLMRAREALDFGDAGSAMAEIELLHNVPSLLGEPNSERHKYFWEQERMTYIEWMSNHGSAEANSRMRTYYYPVWNDMEPLIAIL